MSEASPLREYVRRVKELLALPPEDLTHEQRIEELYWACLPINTAVNEMRRFLGPTWTTSWPPR